MQHHVHWLTATTQVEYNDVITNIMHMLNLEPYDLKKGRYFYKNHITFNNIANVYYTDDESHCCFEFTGTACEILGTRTVLNILEMFKGTATRIDVAVDGCPFTPLQLREHCQAYKGQKMRGVRSRINKEKFGWAENEQGNTLYLGSRQSLRRARIYDRNQDINGDNFTRFELELKKGAAQKAATLLMSDFDNFDSNVRSLIRDFVDFVDDVETNNARNELTTWWQSFVDNAVKTTIKYSDRIVSTIESTCRYMYKNAANFTVMIDALVQKTGRDFYDIMQEYYIEGLARERLKHKNLKRLMGHVDMSKMNI